MALGFAKQYDTSAYNRDEFIEVWPEISEIGLEITEGIIETMDETDSILPGSSEKVIAYIKGCVFILGFSGVDAGEDVDVYDKQTSLAVLGCRRAMNQMGIRIDEVDSIDLGFVRGLASLFETSDEQAVSKLWSVLANARKTTGHQVPKAGAPGVKQGPKPPAADVMAAISADAAAKSVQYSLSRDGSKALSPNFKVSDFRCKDGSDIVLINPVLIDTLEKIRSHFGKPLTITSGYRTPSYNRMLSGAAKNSQHMYGNAADIKIAGVSPKEVYDWINTWHKGGLGRYATFTHVDVRDTVGRDIARWGAEKEKGVA